jgi:hypothetical protein
MTFPQRLPAIVVTADETVGHWVFGFTSWFQRRHPAARFAPADFALADKTTGVFEENSISARAAIRLHANQSRVCVICAVNNAKGVPAFVENLAAIGRTYAATSGATSTLTPI